MSYPKACSLWDSAVTPGNTGVCWYIAGLRMSEQTEIEPVFHRASELYDAETKSRTLTEWLGRNSELVFGSFVEPEPADDHAETEQGGSK